MVPTTSAELPNQVRRYLAPGERIVLVTHHHWARMIEPVATTILAFVVWLLLEANLTAKTASLAPALRIAFALVVARLLWCLFDWRHDWIVVTDKRLLRRHGVVQQHVPMMPFTKVTDMSYVRSIPGRLLHYGEFVMESAGQDQALRVINWVPHPDETYRMMCAEIFHVEPDVASVDQSGDGSGDGSDADLDPADASDAADGADPGASAYPDVPQVHNPISHRLDSYSRAMPVQPARSDEPVYESDDLRKRRRGSRTGPMPFHPHS